MPFSFDFLQLNYRLGHYQEALVDLDGALRADHTNQPASFRRGETLEQLGMQIFNGQDVVVCVHAFLKLSKNLSNFKKRRRKREIKWLCMWGGGC